MLANAAKCLQMLAKCLQNAWKPWPAPKSRPHALAHGSQLQLTGNKHELVLWQAKKRSAYRILWDADNIAYAPSAFSEIGQKLRPHPLHSAAADLLSLDVFASRSTSQALIAKAKGTGLPEGASLLLSLHCDAMQSMVPPSERL